MADAYEQNGAATRRWRRHSPAHERQYRPVSAGVERRGVKKIRRLTACRFESGPRHQPLAALEMDSPIAFHRFRVFERR